MYEETNMQPDRKEIQYVLKNLFIIADSTIRICNDINYDNKCNPMNYRYIFLNLYLWRGYLDRLLKAVHGKNKEPIKELLKEFSLKIYSNNHEINSLRNHATHYEKNEDMLLSLCLNLNEQRIKPTEQLPSYAEMEKYFTIWEITITDLLNSYS